MSPLDFVTPAEAAMIRADAAGLVQDPSLGVSITYQAYTSRTFTPSTGANVRQTTDQVLRAVRSELSAGEVVASAGVYQMGDVRYLIDRATLLATPGTDDRIVEENITYDLVTWRSDPISAFWRIVARRVK